MKKWTVLLYFVGALVFGGVCAFLAHSFLNTGDIDFTLPSGALGTLAGIALLAKNWWREVKQGPQVYEEVSRHPPDDSGTPSGAGGGLRHESPIPSSLPGEKVICSSCRGLVDPSRDTCLKCGEPVTKNVQGHH